MVDMGCPIGYLLPPGCLYSAPSPCMLRACLSNLVCPFAVSAAVGTGYPKENATVKARGFGCGNSAETQDQSWHQASPPAPVAKGPGWAGERRDAIRKGGVGEHRVAPAETQTASDSPRPPRHPMTPSKEVQ
jgi:hypothetical protein